MVGTCSEEVSMNFISRWLETRRKAVESAVMGVAPRDLPAEDSRIHRRSIVRRVKFTSRSEGLKCKPWLVTSMEINSALDRLAREGRLKHSRYHFVSPTKSISTDTFALRA